MSSCTVGARVVNNNASTSSLGELRLIETFAAAKMALAEEEFLWRYCEFWVSDDVSWGYNDAKASKNIGPMGAGGS